MRQTGMEGSLLKVRLHPYRKVSPVFGVERIFVQAAVDQVAPFGEERHAARNFPVEIDAQIDGEGGFESIVTRCSVSPGAVSVSVFS